MRYGFLQGSTFQVSVVFLTHPILQHWGSAMDNRDEMRRLIDLIEKSANSVSLEQAVDDLKTFANTTSFLANKLDSRLKSGDVKKKAAKVRKTGGLPKPPAPPIPKSLNAPKQQQPANGMPSVTSTSISQADYERLKPIGPSGALSNNGS